MANKTHQIFDRLLKKYYPALLVDNGDGTYSQGISGEVSNKPDEYISSTYSACTGSDVEILAPEGAHAAVIQAEGKIVRFKINAATTLTSRPCPQDVERIIPYISNLVSIHQRGDVGGGLHVDWYK